jgi:glutamyl-Q tRNA(Asp) synthetase
MRVPHSANDSSTPYRGRFAPSPTGPLHMGSLIAAVASFLDARKNNGRWLLRIDDLDPPREPAGAADSILRSLRRHGLLWDEEIVYQSKRATAYDAALNQLQQQDQLFQCDCSRKSLGPTGECAGNCRARQAQIVTPSATRVSAQHDPQPVFREALQVIVDGDDEVLPGNFIVRRRDGLYAYQLAVVVDDAYQGVTHIVRGSDLIGTTTRQVYLQQALKLATPQYCHVPVITNAAGQKFSKQHHAPALDDRDTSGNLRAALRFLCQEQPPSDMSSCEQILNFSATAWTLNTIPRTLSIVASS